MNYEVEIVLLNDFWPQKEGAGKHEYTALFRTVFPFCHFEFAPQQIVAREFIDSICSELITYMFYLKNKAYWKDGSRDILNWDHQCIDSLPNDIWASNRGTIIPMFLAMRASLLTHYKLLHGSREFPNTHSYETPISIIFKDNPDYSNKCFGYFKKYDFLTIQKEWKKYVNRVIQEADKGRKQCSIS